MLYHSPSSAPKYASLATITETEGISQDYVSQTHTETFSANPPSESKMDSKSLKAMTSVGSSKSIEKLLNGLSCGSFTETSTEGLFESTWFEELEKETLQCLEDLEAAFQERHEKYEAALYRKAMGTMSCPM